MRQNKNKIFQRREFIKTSSLASLGLLAGLTSYCSNQNTKRPNILFIMSDDHGYQAISAYGSRINKTPNIDRIAKEGMIFDRCYVTNSICAPSRAYKLNNYYTTGELELFDL